MELNTKVSVLIRNTYFLPALLFLFNFCLKFAYLTYGDIGGDEPFTIYYAQTDWGTLKETLKAGNNSPLFFGLQHLWVSIFGISALSTRFLPLVFSSLTATMIFLLGKKFFNHKVALLTAIIFTFSNYHIYFSHETRTYSLFALLTTLSMYFFLSLREKNSAKKHFYLLIFWNVLLIYNHFFGFFVLFIQGVSTLFIADLRKKILKKYLYISLITLVFYLPYLQVLINRFSYSTNGTWVAQPNIESLYDNIRKFSNEPIIALLFLTILAISVFTYFIKKNKIEQTTSHKIIILWFLLPYFTMFGLSFWMPMFLDRYLIFISIGFYFSVGIALNFIGKSKWVFYPLAAVITILLLFTCQPSSSTSNKKKAMIDLIASKKTANTAVYLCPPWLELGFVYYYNIAFFKAYETTREKLNAANVFPIYNPKDLKETHPENYHTVIYVDGDASLVDPENLIYQNLQQEFKNVQTDTSCKGFTVYYFSR